MPANLEHFGRSLPSTLSRFLKTSVVFSAISALAWIPAGHADEASSGVTVEDSGPAGADAAKVPKARMAWWRDAKFGMFIHWGVYAVPARGGEWIMHREKIPVAQYREFSKEFNPVKFDAMAWAKLAKDAGMKYIVITAKHHDGFALFPSDVTDWDIADSTPYRKDLLGPLEKAAHEEGLKFGFYYSQAQDWTHPGGAKSRHEEGGGWDEAHKGSFDQYLAKIALPQVRELLTKYKPDIIWWDTPTHMNAERAKPFADLLAARPDIISNNRLGGGFSGDTHTPEQFVPITGYPGDWETCMTIGKNWGFTKTDTELKSSTDLIRKLADICSKGGNFLLNVGPRPDGIIPEGFQERLLDVGKWLKVNGDSIYGTKAGPFAHLSWGCATAKGSRLFLHVFDWPADGKLRLPLLSPVKSAHLLVEPGTPLKIASAHPENASQAPASGATVVSLPKTAPDPSDSVVVLELDGPPVVAPSPMLGASATATAAQENSPAQNVLDGTGAKKWFAPKEVKEATLTVELAKKETISSIGFDDPDVWPRMSQTFSFEAEVDGQWKPMASGKTTGHGILKKLAEPVTASKFRLTVSYDKGGPGVAEIQLFRPE